MESTLATLDQLIKLLGHKPPMSSDALSLAKNLLRRGPCALELDQLKGVVKEVLELLVKSRFTGDQAKQAHVSRLIDQIQRAPDFDPSAISQEIRKIRGWLHETAPSSTESDAPKRPAPMLPDAFPDRLATALRHLGSADSSVQAAAEEVERLGREEEIPWGEIHAQVARLASSQEVARSHWRAEREELKEALVQMADRFQHMLSGMGDTGDKLNGVIDRIRESNRISDLQMLKDLLLREAEGVLTHADAMRSELEESRQILDRTRERMRQLDQELIGARDPKLQDPLTGIANRFAYMAHFQRCQERYTYFREAFVMIFFTLDNLYDIHRHLGASGSRHGAASAGCVGGG